MRAKKIEPNLSLHMLINVICLAIKKTNM